LVKVVKSSKDTKNVGDDIKYRAATPERPQYEPLYIALFELTSNLVVEKQDIRIIRTQ